MAIQSSTENLTRFPKGSMLEMAAIALPLMLTTLSTSLMMFVDRFVLARYNLESMNAAIIAFIVCAIFIYPLAGVASAADILVGRMNGAKKYKTIARPVWQMLWVCLATWPVFVLLGALCGDFFLAENFEELGGLYYRPIMYFGPLAGLNAAVAAFFLGRGKTRLVLFANIVSNLLNGVLDIVLVFGYAGFPEMGVEGAAIATVIGQGVQFLILFAVFILPQHKDAFGVWDFRIYPKLLKECLRLGVPGSAGHMIEIAAWSLINALIAKAGELHLTLLLLGQNIFVLMAFVTDALNKASAAVASNYVGARDWASFRNSMGGAIRFFFLIIGGLAVVLYSFQSEILDLFVSNQNLSPTLDNIEDYMGAVFAWTVLCVAADGMVWILAANLLALGDSKFLLIINGTAGWLIGVVPTYLIIVVGGAGPMAAWPIVVAYVAVVALCFGLRLRNRYRVRDTLKLETA